jgi:AraC-like DNA-binding protein
MFASATYTASDPAIHTAAIRAANVQAVAVSRGDFQASVTRIDLDRLWMQRGQENLPRTFRSRIPADRLVVSFLSPQTGPTTRLGMEFSSRDIAVGSPGQTVSWRSFGACHWAGMSLPIEDFARWSHVLVGQELKPPPFQRLLTPPPALMSRLQRLHEAAAHLAGTAPEVISHPEATRRLSQSLIEALTACVARGAEHASGTPRRRAQVLARFEAALEANGDRAVQMTEICAAVGVPGRTLRICCAEALGMSPKRYLDLRRMHLARQALLLAAPENESVTKIATRHGFWELGRFATGYRSLFGEAPSSTLKREFRSGSGEIVHRLSPGLPNPHRQLPPPPAVRLAQRRWWHG